jgi:uncharacterized YigZ family protein
MNVYHTIEKPSVAEYKDRGSKFLAYVYPVQSAEEFKKYLKALKDEHPKAAHYCFAYRIGTDGTNFRSSDDGEPAGSAGKPILGQIDSKGVTNVAVIVVRYFGGTLLGVPGLINAYKMATSLGLQLTALIEKPILTNYSLEFDYTLMNDVMMVIKRFGCIVIQQEMQLFCRMIIGIPKADEQVCLDKLSEMHTVALAKQ